MPKKQPQEGHRLRYPSAYVVSLMANRYALEREEGFTLAHFGLLGRSGLLLDAFSCVFPAHSLENQKENLVQYSETIRLPKTKIPTWNPRDSKEFSMRRDASGLSQLTPVVDFIHVSSWQDIHAEICFWNFSQGHLADIVHSHSEEPLTPWGAAMIRCGIDLQREFLAGLYES